MVSQSLKSILLQGKIIEWPNVDTWTYIAFVLFAIFIVLFFVFFNRVLTRRARNETRWNILLSFMLRHDLVIKEIEVVRELYKTLGVSVQEEILTSKKKFYQLVYDFLLNRNELSVEERVKLIEKLFPPTEHYSEIKTLADVGLGEICALESGEDKFLGSVVKKWPEELLISVENFEPLYIQNGSEAGIYFFRPQVGGFILYGNIKQVGPDFVIYRFNGNVEQKSGHHFMASISSDAVFKPWPKPGPNDKAIHHIIYGKTRLFSDRSLLFEPSNEEDVPYYLNHHEIWVMEAKLPEGFMFTCRGLIKQSERYDKGYVFKYLDASETSRNVLYAEIQNNNPVKDDIG